MTLTLLVLSTTGSLVEVRNFTLPMTRRLKFSNVTELLQHDEARHAWPTCSCSLTNVCWGYSVSVGIGVPPTIYNLLVDTGSSVTWVGATTTYVRTGTSIETKEHVVVKYDSASFEGATWDGILGIGPKDLKLHTLDDAPEETIPTVTNFLFERDIITEPVVGIFFQPLAANVVNYGELTFGGADPVLYTSSIEYTDITDSHPSSEHWGIDQAITYGETVILRHTAGIVDSGMTFIFIASDAYKRYKAATGGTVNRANNLLQISRDKYNSLYSLNFSYWARLPTRTGAGLDFINGYVFLQRFYTVFDTKNSRIGFAETRSTYALPTN
ncbi:aspartic peptidase domain-containing protein, partial [Suillus spraguei]